MAGALSIFWQFLQVSYVEHRSPTWQILRFRPQSEPAMVRVFEYIHLDFQILTFLRRLPKHGNIVKRHWFPGYAFVRFDLERDRWHQLAQAPGTIEILGKPTPVPDEIIYDLQRRCPMELLKNEPDASIPAGSEVKVLEGPLRDVTGIVAASAGPVVWVELIAFNRPVRTELKTRNVMVIR